jgi:hypothetical protein
MTRRSWLVLGLGGLMLSAVSRVAIAGPTQLEAEGYGGTSVGQWTCGPTARANYGGVGGHMRIYTADPPAPVRPEEEANAGAPAEEPSGEATAESAARAEPPPAAAKPVVEQTFPLEPHGFSIGAGGGGEYRAYSRIACSDTPCSPTKDVMPEAGLLVAGRANLGFDWDYFGFRAGALGFQRYADNTDRSPTTTFIPDIDLRIGRRAGFHGGLGFGAYSVSTIFRPGLFLGLGYAGEAWAADVRAGVHATFDDGGGGRVDLGLRYLAASRWIAPGVGVAVSSGEQASF